VKYAKYCCQDCGEPVGYLGRLFEWLFGRMHRCAALASSRIAGQEKKE